MESKMSDLVKVENLPGLGKTSRHLSLDKVPKNKSNRNLMQIAGLSCSKSLKHSVKECFAASVSFLKGEKALSRKT